MFSGEFYYKIDVKGRLSVPSAFRAEGGGTYFVTYGPDRCLFVYDEPGFKQREAELQQLDHFDPRVRSLNRVFFSGTLQECDSHGRIKIPAAFIEYAGMEKDVVLNGMATHFEIWGKERWDKQRQDDIGSYFENYREMTSLNSRNGK